MDRQDSHPNSDEKQDPLSSGDKPSSTDDHAKPPPSKKIKRCIRKRKDQCTQHTLKSASGGKSSAVSKNYHKQVSCSVCGMTTRDDHVKRHMSAKHVEAPLSVRVKPTAMKKCVIRSMKRKRAPKLPDTVSGFVGKSSSKPEEVKVMFSTACAMKTVTDTLHWAFKHIHDETASIFGMKGIDDASERVTNVLAPIEEQIAMNLQQHICHVVDELKRETCSLNVELINSGQNV